MRNELKNMRSFIYQRSNWPHFNWKHEEILQLLGTVRNAQGVLTGKMLGLGLELKNEAALETLTLDVIKSSEIEGEILNPDKVRSSIAFRLGLDGYGISASDRGDIDGIVDITMDATLKCDEQLTEERLFDWHAALFPTGRSGIHKITVGEWRTDSYGPMQVVSKNYTRVHFQAPDAEKLYSEMNTFIHWFNEERNLDPLIKAGIAHLWFITLHPFDDGNGRLARALTDMLIARSDGNSQRYYSMSAQVNKEKGKYYDILEQTQKGTLDITRWLIWFLECTKNALDSTDKIIERVLLKHSFWNNHVKTSLNNRQINLISKLLEGFEGKLTTVKWAKIAKCSEDTALRDIKDLLNKGILKQSLVGGRKAGYELIVE